MDTLPTGVSHEATHPVWVHVEPALERRNRLTAVFGLLLTLPHLVAIWARGIAWAFTTIVGWFAMLLAGRFPRGLYRFGVGVLQ